jgi:hypothetical protein
MKQIAPIQIWVNGSLQTATLFSLIIINDNLSNSAIFYYQLLDADATKLADGNLTMGEPTYDQWGTSSDVNQWAYEWAATELNITLA